MHRTGVAYPEDARKRGIQGTVVVQVKIDGSGNVADAQVLSGPDELRKAALTSVLNWHFGKETAGSFRQVTIQFDAGVSVLVSAPAPPPPAPAGRGGKKGSVGGIPVQPPTIKSIAITGVSDQAAAELLAKLPVHEGDVLRNELVAQLIQTVSEFDSHLNVMAVPGPEGVTVDIRPSYSASRQLRP